MTGPSSLGNQVSFPASFQSHERAIPFIHSALPGSKLLPTIVEQHSPASKSLKVEKPLPQIPTEPTQETVPAATQEGYDVIFPLSSLNPAYFRMQEQERVQESNDSDHTATIDQGSETESPVDAELEGVPETAEQFKTVLVQCVESNHLDTFFGPDDSFIQKVSALATNLRASDDPLLQSAENVDRLTCLTLYQLVIYCDDSGSMAGGLYNTQQQLVSRIVSLATKILPDDYGVELRFINSEFARNVRTSQVEAAVASVRPTGATPIGTNLRRKILEPLIYNVLSTSDKRIRRPFLVCTITDGYPNNEPESRFKDEIVECRKTLKGANYHPKSAMFCISQIGNNSSAFAFLQRLRIDSEIQDVLYCTSDQLDEKFREFKDNERVLDEWLLKTLTTPLMTRMDD